MPRLPIDYANTIIYKIVCNDLSITECYVGHTTDFVRRKHNHKNRCRNETDKKHNLKVYKTIRDTGGWENYSMLEVEKYPCKSSNEACAKEREWFENLCSNLNTCYPQRSKAEYYETNREEILIKQRQYNEDNREQIVFNSKQRREDNKGKNSIKRSKKFVCECGVESSYDHKSRHLRTIFHNNYLKTLN